MKISGRSPVHPSPGMTRTLVPRSGLVKVHADLPRKSTRRLTDVHRGEAAAGLCLRANRSDGGRFGLYSLRAVSGTMSAAHESGEYELDKNEVGAQ